MEGDASHILKCVLCRARRLIDVECVDAMGGGFRTAPDRAAMIHEWDVLHR